MSNLLGYRILDREGNVVDEVVGHVARKVLDKYRNKGYRVKKLTMPKRVKGELLNV